MGKSTGFGRLKAVWLAALGFSVLSFPSVSLAQVVNLSVEKTLDGGQAVPGTSVTYTIVVTNAGPDDAPGTAVADTMPLALENVEWSCEAFGGADCAGLGEGTGNIAGTVDIPAGDSVAFTVTGDLLSSATGLLENSVTVDPDPTLTDPDGSDNGSVSSVAMSPVADVVVELSDEDATEAIPGETITYTITVTNNGPSDAPDVVVTDVFPPALVAVVWECEAADGATCTASGSGDIVDVVALPVEGSVVYTVSATVAGDASGNLENSVTVTVGAGVSDPDLSNNEAGDSNLLTPEVDVSVEVEGPDSAVPGESVVFTITVENAGPSDAVGTGLSGLLPPELLSATWSCAASPGSVCSASGSGNLSDTVLVRSEGTLVYTLEALISPAAADTLEFTVAVSVAAGIVDADDSNDESTGSTELTPEADVVVTVSNGVASLIPGTTVLYVVTVTNLGPSDAAEVAVESEPGDEESIAALSWECSASPGANCSASGVDALSDTAVIPAGASVVYQVEISIAPSATETFAYSVGATVGDPATDPDEENSIATDEDLVAPVVDLSVSMSVDVISAVPGVDTVTYTITVSNAGPSDAVGVSILGNWPDPESVLETTVGWECSADEADERSDCGEGSGDGLISDTVSVQAGGSLVYEMVVELDPCEQGPILHSIFVEADPGSIEASPGDEVASTSVALVPAVDLAILGVEGDEEDFRTDAPDPQYVCRQITYRLSVTNLGPSCAHDVMLTSLAPNTVFNAAAVPSADDESDEDEPSISCTGAGGVTTCELGLLPPEESVEVEYGLIVGFGAKGGVITNQMSVSAEGTEEDSDNNNFTETTRVRSDDPYLVTVTALPKRLTVGRTKEQRHRVFVRSLCDPSLPTNVRVDTVIPGELDVIAVDPPPATNSAGVVTHQFPGLTTKDAKRITVRSRLREGLVGGGCLSASALVSDNQGAEQEVNASSILLPFPKRQGPAVSGPSIKLSAPNLLRRGRLSLQTLAVVNSSPRDLENVVVTLEEPEAMLVEAASPPLAGQSVSSGTRTLTWFFPRIATSKQAKVRLRQRVGPTAPLCGVFEFVGRAVSGSEGLAEARRTTIVTE